MLSYVHRRCLNVFTTVTLLTAWIWRPIIQLLHFQGPQLLQPPSRIDFTPRTYEDYAMEKGVEPYPRFLRLVYQHFRLKWHLKVTFNGKLQTSIFAKKTQRQQDLVDLCLCIDFDLLEPQLLKDTVTELIITYQNNASVDQSWKLPLKATATPYNESDYASIVSNLVFCIREDPCRVRFPVYSGGRILTKSLFDIDKEQEFSMGVHKAHVRDEDGLYVYKEVDRPMYEPRDSEVLEQELRNLTLLRGEQGLLQLVAPVVSKNPYQTSATAKHNQIVLRGILTEYHPKDTLQNALQSSQTDLPWHRWAVQITIALLHLHTLGIPHMDLKPANIVLSEDLNAILIDLSGIGGTTREWLSPEMENVSEPLFEGIESRMQNDVWALGKILFAIAGVTCDGTEKHMLLRVSTCATTEAPRRIPLVNALRYLTTFPL